MPPNAASIPNADLNINAKSAGTASILMIIIITAINIYIIAINGTTAVAALAIHLIPPYIIRPIMIATKIAITQGFNWNAFFIELDIALDWTPGNHTPHELP